MGPTAGAERVGLKAITHRSAITHHIHSSILIVYQKLISQHNLLANHHLIAHRKGWRRKITLLTSTGGSEGHSPLYGAGGDTHRRGEGWRAILPGGRIIARRASPFARLIPMSLSKAQAAPDPKGLRRPKGLQPFGSAPANLMVLRLIWLGWRFLGPHKFTQSAAIRYNHVY